MKISRKWQLAASAIIVIFIAASCSITVPESNVYTEASDSTNSTTPENTGFAFTSGTWFQIDGTFNGSSDDDEYRVDTSSLTGFTDLLVYHNGKEVKDGLILDINDFPIAIYPYSSSGSLLVNMLVAASGDGVDWSEYGSASYVIINVYAADSTILGASLPFTSGTYSVQFR